MDPDLLRGAAALLLMLLSNCIAPRLHFELAGIAGPRFLEGSLGFSGQGAVRDAFAGQWGGANRPSKEWTSPIAMTRPIPRHHYWTLE